ncbi:MAG: HAMP domain-containing protein [Candidatus Adiutrix intracellularis]|nr:HAMP domain-containing protein [Candidatus Adiutrix intracellularis]
MSLTKKNINQTCKSELSPKQLQRKHKLECWALIIVGVSFLFLTLVQRRVIELGPGLNKSQGLVALVSINFSVLLMVFLILLILRGLYNIFFENRSYGTLQTKMVVAFICLSLLPTILIFYYSYRQLVRGHDLWFSPLIENALIDSIGLTEGALAMDNRLLTIYGEDIFNSFNELPSLASSSKIKQFLEEKRALFHLASVELYDQNGRLLEQAEPSGEPIAPIYHDWFAGQFGQPLPWVNTAETTSGDLTYLVWPLFINKTVPSAGVLGFLAISRLALVPIRSQIEDVRHALVGYQDALNVQQPFRVTQLTGLTAMALLSVFVSIWIGSHLARSLARPVTELVAGTQKVAAGNWDFILKPQGRSGELVELVNSFNQMTKKLKEMYAELDSRRRFVETVLKNVSTGVVILNQEGGVISLNQSALDILALTDGCDSALPAPLAALVKMALTTPRPLMIENNIRLNLKMDFLSLRSKIASLQGENDELLGYLLTFDDLTELEKAQRLAAWREVARRIAHEVKNPLTPIQLAAERLLRRFSEQLAGQENMDIFEECTAVIIRQVEEMKKLVDEFSRFARLPETKPRLGDFTQMLSESLTLFRQAHKKIDFNIEIRTLPPIFAFDCEQMRRVLANILNNAVTAMKGEGQISLILEFDEIAGLRLSVSDTGPGIDSSILERLFEPQVTTKNGGQGLGLAIVSTIIRDHGGFIRAQNNPSGGTKFTIELPLRQFLK